MGAFHAVHQGMLCCVMHAAGDELLLWSSPLQLKAFALVPRSLPPDCLIQLFSLFRLMHRGAKFKSCCKRPCSRKQSVEQQHRLHCHARSMLARPLPAEILPLWTLKTGHDGWKRADSESVDGSQQFFTTARRSFGAQANFLRRSSDFQNYEHWLFNWKQVEKELQKDGISL